MLLIYLKEIVLTGKRLCKHPCSLTLGKVASFCLTTDPLGDSIALFVLFGGIMVLMEMYFCLCGGSGPESRNAHWLFTSVKRPHQMYPYLSYQHNILNSVLVPNSNQHSPSLQKNHLACFYANRLIKVNLKPLIVYVLSQKNPRRNYLEQCVPRIMHMNMQSLAICLEGIGWLQALIPDSSLIVWL